LDDIPFFRHSGESRNPHNALQDSGFRRNDELRRKLNMLEIKNLHVKLADEDRVIINGLNLSVKAGEVHAIMGPNGSGKSTLSYVLSGREGYEVTEGSVTYKGEDLLAMEPDVRASKGVFLAFQYPIEIPGVATMQFLKVALNSQKKARGEKELSTPDFMRLVKERAARLNISPDMLKRPVNVGFSGGEKKRAEILQMAVLEPTLCVLDETDSGLDIDAMRVVADGVNSLRSPDRAMIVITHYQRLLDYIVPDQVHVLSQGRIVKSGGKSLALELESRGYAEFAGEAA
jgi:Fe-S cluster assembly ATP-binding protein